MVGTSGRHFFAPPVLAAITAAAVTAGWTAYVLWGREIGLPSVPQNGLTALAALFCIGLAAGLASGRVQDVPATIVAGVVAYGLMYWLVYEVDPEHPRGDTPDVWNLAVLAAGMVFVAGPGHLCGAVARRAWSSRHPGRTQGT